MFVNLSVAAANTYIKNCKSCLYHAVYVFMIMSVLFRF